MRTGEAKLIVLCPALLVAQHVVGFLHFLEACLGLFVPGIAVRMILARQLAVRFLDLVLGSVALDAQSFIEVAGHGWSAACELSGMILSFILAPHDRVAKTKQNSPPRQQGLVSLGRRAKHEHANPKLQCW